MQIVLNVLIEFPDLTAGPICGNLPAVLLKQVVSRLSNAAVPPGMVSKEKTTMKDTLKNTPKGIRPRRGRTLAPLSERLATIRNYPRFGSSALTGVLR